MKTRNKKWKAPSVIFYIFLFFIGLLFLQYVYLTIFPNLYGINMKEFAANRNTYSKTLYAKRGTIYDSENNALALDISSYTVIAYLDESRTGSGQTLYHVKDKVKTAKALAPILNMSEESLLTLLNKDSYQVELGPGGRGITELVKNKIKALNLPGIDFIESFKRYYPNGDFASYLVGYAKKKEIVIDDNKETVINGELGIEVEFDDILKGINGNIQYQQDRYGYKIPDTPEINKPASNGSDVYLTIDSSIQRIVEQSLNKSEELYNPEWITISIMDAKTGDILGSSSTPSFDPNILNIVNYENPLTSFVYEPGSVMKIYTYMCALEKGTYKGDETYPSGKIVIEDKTIYDWNRVGWGNISYDYGFKMSSNVGVSYMTQKFINKDDLKNCLTNYGFGQKTNIQLPRELEGIVKFNYPVEVAAASYGQGISTTAIQHLQALSIIANDGTMITPNIVKKITNNGKTTFERQIHKKENVTSKKTTDHLKKLMHDTIIDGTGKGYQVKNLEVIGKTGTAQIFDNETGGYLTGWSDNIYSFSGMFPKENPEIIIFASIKRPKNGASDTVVSLVQPIIESVAKYKGLIKGTVNEDNLKKYTLTSYINADVKTVKESLKGLDVVVIGDGDKVINQYPKDKTVVLTGDKVYLLTNSKQLKMPDLTNYSRIEAISLLDLINVPYEIDGYGTVISQSIKPDTIITNEKIKLTLKEKHEFDKKTT